MNLLFVHGVGTRRIDYEPAFELIRRQADKVLPGVNVLRCLWGDDYGATLGLAGASIPREDRTASPAIGEIPWGVLVSDPFIELKLLSRKGQKSAGFGAAIADEGELLRRLIEFEMPQDCRELLLQWGIEDVWQGVVTGTFANAGLHALIQKVDLDSPQFPEVLSRVLTAALLAKASELKRPPIDATMRTAFASRLTNALGGEHLGLTDSVLQPLASLCKWGGTLYLKGRRSAWSDAASPFAGDVVMYQARGNQIREFIREQLLRAPDEVVIVAHSLGGIACVDLLIESDLRNKVRALVTVGSQSPLFYELNALSSLPLGQTLPTHFPQRWLNFFDPNDFLSYVGEEVFPGRVRDVRVESGISFPESHSAYWRLDHFWKELAGGVDWAS